MDVRKKKKKLYTLLAISAAFLCVLTVLLLISNSDSLKLSVKDGDTITLEYGIDTIPTVSALYWESVFDKEGEPVEVTSQGSIDENTIGTYHITYTATHEKKTISATQTIIIQDTTPPTLTLTGGETGYYSPGYSYQESGYTAIDNHDGDITEQVICKQNADNITYTVTDSFGNTTTLTRKLECKDVVAPAISLHGDAHVLLNYGDSYTDPGAVAIDDVDGDLTASMTVTGTIDSSVYGEQYITYSVTDSNGNIAQKERVVVVKESVPPELLLNGESRFFVKLNEEYVEPGYTAIDNADGDISPLVKVEGSVDTSKIGAYTLTYTSTDSSNNSVSLTRTVYVYNAQGYNDVEPNGKIVYLSFDDGPGPYTQQLLDILDKYNVKVTFFVTAQYSDYIDLIGEAYRRGHTIAMHTYSHRFENIYASSSAYYEDLNKIKALCEAQTGVSPTIVRFPGGTSNTASKKHCPGIMTSLTQSLPANGYQYCDWNVDSMDAGGAKTAQTVAQNVISAIPEFKNSFVLQHDTKQYSVEAVEKIITWGLANGYVFMPMNANSPMFHHPALN